MLPAACSPLPAPRPRLLQLAELMAEQRVQYQYYRVRCAVEFCLLLLLSMIWSCLVLFWHLGSIKGVVQQPYVSPVADWSGIYIRTGLSCLLCVDLFQAWWAHRLVVAARALRRRRAFAQRSAASGEGQQPEPTGSLL